MSSSVPDEGAPRSSDKWRDLSAAIAGTAPRPYVVRGNYWRPSPVRAREREARTRVYETLNASQHCRLADRGIACTRQIVSPRCNNRAKTAYPPSSPLPPYRFSLSLSLSLSLSFSLSPRNIPTVQPHTRRINAPTGLPIVNARNVHTDIYGHACRPVSQCPNIPQSKTARRLLRDC